MSDPNGVFRVDIANVQIDFNEAERSSLCDSKFHLALNFDQFWKGKTKEIGFDGNAEWSGTLTWERITYFQYRTSQIHRLKTKIFEVVVLETNSTSKTPQAIAIVNIPLQTLALGPMVQEFSFQEPRILTVRSFIHMESITPVKFQLSSIALLHLPPTNPFAAIRCRVSHNQNKSQFIEFEIEDEATPCASPPALQVDLSLQEALNGSIQFTFSRSVILQGEEKFETAGFCEYPVKKHVLESFHGHPQDFRHTIDHHVMSIGIVSGSIQVSNLPIFAQMKDGILRNGGS